MYNITILWNNYVELYKPETKWNIIAVNRAIKYLTSDPVSHVSI